MKQNILCWLMAGLMFVLSGCLMADETTSTLDYAAGTFEVEYYDIRSQKDEGEEDTLEKDWASLKEMLSSTDDFGPHVNVTSKKIFQEDDVLCGKAVYQVQCKECFESKLELLKHLFGGLWNVSNNEITLTFSEDEWGEANGKMTVNGESTIYSWPMDADRFEVTVYDDHDGRSLLDKYLSEHATNPDP